MRERFRCVRCNLRIEGQRTPTGKIVVSDRSPAQGEEQPCVCAACEEKGATK